MMFKKIPIIAPLVFFLLGIHVFAQTNNKTSFPENGTVITIAGNHHISASKYNQNTVRAAEKITDKKQEPFSPKPVPTIAAYIVSVIVGGLLFIGLVFYWFIYKRRISKHSQKL